MGIGARPAAEAAIDASLARALLADQHPDLADRELVEAASGWDNVLYRVGDDLVARLPRREAAAALVQHEQRWLPELAARLPLPVPVPVRVGRPALGYPWAWSVCRWLPGEPAVFASALDPRRAALALAEFLRALHRPAPPDAPHNPYRGVPLAERAERVLDTVERLGPEHVDPGLLARWNEWSRAPAWPGPPMWLHGDLHPANLLAADGRLCAVIDFGDLCGGDPAVDLAVAWMLLPPAAHGPLAEYAAELDAAAWTRARAWALALGLAHLASSADSASSAIIGRRTLDALLAVPG
ncbi:MAG: aminoglycoside phosphotransferase family protein [Acidimicrobiales bacterium]